MAEIKHADEDNSGANSSGVVNSQNAGNKRVDRDVSPQSVTVNRELSPDEETSLAKGKKRWLPRIFQSYGTPIPELMASPWKTGLLFGAPAALLGAGVGSALSGRNNPGTANMNALLGALAVGLPVGALAGADRDAKNEGLEELMRRLPENAAKRDLLADPQYQKDFLKWDDSQIVAQARARYYRPAERFNPAAPSANAIRGSYNKFSSDASRALGNFTGVKFPFSPVLAGDDLTHILQAEKQALTSQADTQADKDVSMNQQQQQNQPQEQKHAALRLLLNNKTASLAEKAAAIPKGLPGGSYADRPSPFDLQPAAVELPAGATPLERQVSVSPGEVDAKVPVPVPDITRRSQPSKPGRDYNTATNALNAMVKRRQAAEERANLKPIVDHINKVTGKGSTPAVSSTAAQAPFGPPGGVGDRIASGLADARDGLASAGKGVASGVSSLGKWLKPDAPKVPDPTLFDKLKPYAPYAAVGGASLGALALADYLSRRNKNTKKKKPAESSRDEEDSRPARKAASLNWYALKNEKQSMIPTPYALPMAPAAIKAMTNPSVLARLRALAGRGVAAAKPYAPYAEIAALGGVGGAGGIYGLSKYLGSGASPTSGGTESMLQQIMNSKYTPYAAAGLGTAGLLGGAAYMGSRAGKSDAKKKNKKPDTEKKSNLGAAGMGAGAGAALGGLGGGLYGALSDPGHDFDAGGRKKKRSRLVAALKGALGGAALGGVGGAGAGLLADKYAPGMTNNLLDQLGMGKELQLPAQTALDRRADRVAQLPPKARQMQSFLDGRNKLKVPKTPSEDAVANAQQLAGAYGEEPGAAQAVSQALGGQ